MQQPLRDVSLQASNYFGEISRILVEPWNSRIRRFGKSQLLRPDCNIGIVSKISCVGCDGVIGIHNQHKVAIQDEAVQAKSAC